jgi:hypothetical protein
MQIQVKRINLSECHYAIDLFDQYRMFYNQPSDKKVAREFIQERLEKNESILFVAFEKQEDKFFTVVFTQL